MENKVYDGTSALTGKTASYTDVTGKTVTVPMKTYLTTYSGGKPNLDTSAPVTAPIAAGIYGIQATITDDNYKWIIENGNANVMNVYMIVYLKADAIYVGDSAGDVNLTTGNASNISGYNWTVDTIYSGFDSNQPRTTVANVKITSYASCPRTEKAHRRYRSRTSYAAYAPQVTGAMPVLLYVYTCPGTVMVIVLGAGYAETCKSGSGGGSAETSVETQYGAAESTSHHIWSRYIRSIFSIG